MTLPLTMLSIRYFLSLLDTKFSWLGSTSLSAVTCDQKSTTLETLIGLRSLPINQKGCPAVKGVAKVRLSSSWETLKRIPDFSGSVYST